MNIKFIIILIILAAILYFGAGRPGWLFADRNSFSCDVANNVCKFSASSAGGYPIGATGETVIFQNYANERYGTCTLPNGLWIELDKTRCENIGDVSETLNCAGGVTKDICWIANSLNTQRDNIVYSYLPRAFDREGKFWTELPIAEFTNDGFKLGRAGADFKDPAWGFTIPLSAITIAQPTSDTPQADTEQSSQEQSNTEQSTQDSTQSSANESYEIGNDNIFTKIWNWIKGVLGIR